MINEPQLTYLLELLNALGEMSDNFVLAGARAIGFNVNQARHTKDFDFILNVVVLSKSSASISKILSNLGYKHDEASKYFQFTKIIPGSDEPMRIEFMASDIGVKPKEIRVNVQEKIHAHACTGAEIALQESHVKILEGHLPDGETVKTSIRVVKPNALLMLKLFAMDDRFKNIRGPREFRHDRDEARIHSSDIVTLVRYNIQKPDFNNLFWSQFKERESLKNRISDIISGYFKELNNPGIQLYREFLLEQTGVIDETEINRALREINILKEN